MLDLEWFRSRREQRERAMRLTEEHKEGIASVAAKTIYKLGRKTGRRFVSRNTVSRTKILRALHNASKEVLGEQDYDYYATYRTFDIDANSAVWKATLALLRHHVELWRRQWWAIAYMTRRNRLQAGGDK